jgi:transcriptional regulator GlxA family with amidase domain
MVESLSALQLMKRIWHCSETSGPFDNLALDGLLLQFFAHVAGAPAISPFGAEAVEDKRMRRVIDYIEAHLEQPINVAELAGVAALSAGHFSRAFKATTGEAVWAYVQRRRCERAKEWLIASTDPIAKIAFDCGFSSQAHMTRQFTARFGVTPGAMRKHY